MEKQYRNLTQKDPRIIWRGALDVGSGERDALVKESSGKDWADVEALDWSVGTPANIINIEDHCKYQFIAHTEGEHHGRSL